MAHAARLARSLGHFQLSFGIEKVSASHLLFDFDGTLVDSAALHDWAFREALAAAAPRALARFDYSDLKGLSTREACIRLGISERISLESCVARKRALYRSAVRAGRLSAFEDARGLLQAVLDLDGDNYLVTSGSAESVNLGLDQLDLRRFFAGIVTSDDRAAGKPNPDLYLRCLRNFGLGAADSIAVEDALAGVLSAKAAGLRVIGVHDSKIASSANFYFPTLSALGVALRKCGRFEPRPH
jgi:HAD superfamily hydrolase (TIGR01509 family)